jgi:hypothetical protein
MKHALRLAIATTCWASVAFAQSAGDKAAAEALYIEGTKLMVSGDYASACPKLAESERLDPGIGTALFLADCYEKMGKTASAWAQFREAEDLASRQGDAKRAEVAKKHADRLEPSLLRLTIAVSAGGDVAGLEVKRDRAIVGRGQLQEAVPVDPGNHTVSATAPKKKTWTTTVAVKDAATSVLVPALVDDPDAIARQSEPTGADREDPAKARKIVGLAVAGAGVVGVGFSLVLGFAAQSKYAESNQNGHCDPQNRCDSTGAEDRRSASGTATLATIVFAVGVAATGAGLALFLTAPKKKMTVGIGPGCVRVSF